MHMKEKTMAKTAAISMRVDPVVKSDAESIFGSFGLTLADAINVFLHKSIQVGGMPFDLKQPRYNEETEAAIQEARDFMQGKVKAKACNSPNDETIKEIEYGQAVLDGKIKAKTYSSAKDLLEAAGA